MGRQGGGRGAQERRRKNTGGGGPLEMASKGLAVTMVPPSSVSVGTDLPQC